MLCLIPVSQSDVQRLPKMAELLEYLGPNRGHRLLVAYDVAVSPVDVETFCQRMKPLFDAVESEKVMTSKKGWPVGPNQMFRECAKAAQKRGLPWLNLELDCVPMRRGWLQERQEEYDLRAKPFTGAIVPTRGWLPQPEGPPKPVLLEPHLVGGGAVYPPGYASASVKLSTVDRLMRWAGAMEPYDIACRHETTPHAYNSPLVQHNFRTCNYRQDGDVIVCDNAEGNAQDHSKPVDPRAGIIHGVKDDSLIHLVTGGAKPKAAPATVAPAADESVAESPPPPAPPEEPQPERAKPAIRSYIATRLDKLLKDGRKRRYAEAAKELGIEADMLRAEIAKPDSGYGIAKAGWLIVQEKETVAA